LIWNTHKDRICLCAVQNLINRSQLKKPGGNPVKFLASFAVCVGIALLTGCHSTEPPGGTHFASVEIRGNTPGQISEAAVEVFKADGYELAHGGPTHMVFERKASAMSNLAYGNWLDTAVWERVKASIVPVSEATFRLQCQAYMVRDRGGTTEEELKLSGMHSSSYQKLLDKVAKQLNQAQAH
jgi:hypothetical protein